jgi:hypothetical protein
MLVLRGFVGLLAMLLVLLGALQGGAVVASRLLSLPSFRWFAPRPMPAPLGKRLMVRAASALAPLGACLLVGWVAIYREGTSVLTTTVEVLPGAAERASMLDGDHVLSIDGVKMDSWEAIRATAKPGRGPAHIEVERLGQRRVIVVEPGADGRFGLTSKPEQHAVGVVPALERALELPSGVYGAVLHSMIQAQNEKVEVSGPIGIVRATERQRGTGSVALFMVFLGLYLWPWLVGVHLWDALTLALFARTHAWALEPSTPELITRLCRLHQALGLSVLGSLTLLLFTALLQIPLVSAVVFPLVVLLAPLAIGLYALVWVTAKARFDQRAIWIVPAVAVAMVPCAGLFAAAALLHWLRRELAKSGLTLGWFTATPVVANA